MKESTGDAGNKHSCKSYRSQVPNTEYSWNPSFYLRQGDVKLRVFPSASLLPLVVVRSNRELRFEFMHYFVFGAVELAVGFEDAVPYVGEEESENSSGKASCLILKLARGKASQSH